MGSRYEVEGGREQATNKVTQVCSLDLCDACTQTVSCWNGTLTVLCGLKRKHRCRVLDGTVCS